MRGAARTKFVGSIAVLGALVLPAGAAVIPAASPDDVCGPTDDPCIVDKKYEVVAPGSVLDFGTRTVRIVSGGQFQKTLDLRCGDLEVQVGNSVAFDTQDSGGVAGALDINASGSVDLDGKITARGNPGGSINIDAVGDVTIHRRILADGIPTGSDGGTIMIMSSGGSVTTNERLVSKSVKGLFNDPPEGGACAITATNDVIVNGNIEAGGGYSGGTSTLDAGGSMAIHAGIDLSAGGGLPNGTGGYDYIYSENGLVIDGPATGTRISASATTGFYVSPYGYKYPYPGYGGQHYIRNRGGDAIVSSNVKFYANGGAKAGENGSQGGWIYLSTYGNLTFDGDFTAKGYGQNGYAGYFSAYSPYILDVGSTAKIDLRSKQGGSASLIGYYGLYMDGTVDVRGNNMAGGYYSYYGYGGYVDLRAQQGDMEIGGHVLQGADGGSQNIDLYGCRLRLEPTALLSAKHGTPHGAGSVYIYVEESVYAAPGSRVLADAQGGGEVYIDYGNPNKPLVLNGTIEPPPNINASLGTTECAVCGNGEIDISESCDDGNTTNGDNCNSECQDEGCIAQTPGYPGTPLCDDGSDCTLNICDPVTHQCSNPVSCEEGIACTQDLCVASSCTHTPQDSLCDDFNECTDDMCNPTAGCVHTNLDAVPCEDGDLCTVTGDCSIGTCVATDTSYATRNGIKLRFSTAPDDDRMSYKGELPLADFTTSPTATGMAVELRDGNDQTLLGALIPAGSFVDKSGSGEKFTFRDKDHALSTGDGVVHVGIKKIASKGIAKVRIKAADKDLSGADGAFRLSISMLFGTDPAADDCVTARFVPCEPSDGKNKCSDL